MRDSQAKFICRIRYSVLCSQTNEGPHFDSPSGTQSIHQRENERPCAHAPRQPETKGRNPPFPTEGQLAARHICSPLFVHVRPPVGHARARGAAPAESYTAGFTICCELMSS